MSKPTHLSMLTLGLEESVKAVRKNSKYAIVKEILSIPRSSSMYEQPGTILRINLQNFLTHRDKTVDFQRPITLIHGENGSGKSSVLEAIEFLLLGSRSRIRENIESLNDLKTQVLLRATKQSVPVNFTCVTGWFWAGNGVVAIERRYETTSIYKINYYDETDKFRTVKTVEVYELLLSWGHLPDNTATMVSESAMKKLAREDPAQRYQTFQQASALDVIENSSLEVVTNLQELLLKENESQQIQKEIESNIEEIQKRLNDNQKFVNMVSQAASLQVEIMSLGAEELGLQCRKQESEIKEYESKEVEPIEDIISNIQETLKECKNSRGLQLDKLVAMNQSKQKQVELIETITGDYEQEQMITTRLQVDYSEIDSEIKTITNSIENYEAEIQKAEKYIINNPIEEFELLEPTEPIEIKQLQVEIGKEEAIQAVLEEAFNEASQHETDVRNKIDAFTREYAHYNEKLDQQQESLHEYEQELEFKRQKNDISQEILQSLSPQDQEAANRIKSLHINATLLAAGVSIKTEYSRYEKVVKQYITPSDLGQFVCQNEDTSRILQVSGQGYKVLSIRQVYSGEQLPDTIAGIPVVPLLEVLEFENDEVKTALLMLKHIDKVVITERIEDADKILTENPRVIVLPVNARAFLQNINNSLSSKPLKLFAYRDATCGSVIYMEPESDIELILEKINIIEREILNLRKQGQVFDDFDEQVEKMEETLDNLGAATKEAQKEYKGEVDMINEIIEQRKIYLMKYEQELDAYNTARREHEDKIQQLDQQTELIFEYEAKLEVEEQSLPQAEQKYEKTEATYEEEVNKLAALKKILDEQTVELNEIKIEIQQEKEYLEENFDEDALKERLKGQEERLQLYLIELGLKEERLNFLNQDYEEHAQEAQTAARNLVNSTERLKSFLRQSESASEFSKLLSGVLENGDMAFIQSQKQEIYKALQDLQQQIESEEHNMSIDVELENEQLEQNVFNFHMIKEQTEKVSLQIHSIINSVACQQIKLHTLRKRAEKEIVAAFAKQSQELEIDLSLEFKFSPLLVLSNYCDQWTDYVQESLYHEYMQVISSEVKERGQIIIKSTQRDISSLSGGEQTFAALSFLISLCKIVQTAYLQIDEFDVFMDAKRRETGFMNLVEVLGQTLIETVLVTPNDIDIAYLNEGLQNIIGIVRMDAIERE